MLHPEMVKDLGNGKKKSYDNSFCFSLSLNFLSVSIHDFEDTSLVSLRISIGVVERRHYAFCLEFNSLRNNWNSLRIIKKKQLQEIKQWQTLIHVADNYINVVTLVFMV